MIQENYFTENKDVLLHFHSLIDWEEIINEYENGFSDHQEYLRSKESNLEMAPSTHKEARDYYNEILTSYGELTGLEVSQEAAHFDKEGLTFKDGIVTHPKKMEELVMKFYSAGLVPVAIQRKYGGLGLPHTVKALLTELLYRADTSFTVAVSSVNLAAIIQDIAGEEQKQRIIPKLLRDKYSMTMGLSEPNYGSDLPSVTTKAELIDGKWYLTGTKRFQTMACGINGNPSATLCLARTGKPGGGARGLSFFFVDGKDYSIAGIEKKMGIKASATCEVVYEKSPAELLGTEGYGLTRYVMGMLNGARMSVAAEGVGVSTAAYREALKFASERIQFGKPIKELAPVKRMLDRMEREISAMRNLMLEGARTVDLYSWKSLRQKNSDSPLGEEEKIKFWNGVSTVITPLGKFYNAEIANSLCYDAIQIFGGSGFCEEYDVARFYRDIRIASIWDGTSQIQVNAAIGGIVLGLHGSGVFGQYLKTELNSFSASPELKQIFSDTESIVSLYKKFPTSEEKEYYSRDVVMSTCRLLIGILFEKQETKIPSNEKESRIKMRKDYNKESLAELSAIKIRLS
jgi:alkylation response protein AidB-like acyl-CoA dehydrogenase